MFLLRARRECEKSHIPRGRFSVSPDLRLFVFLSARLSHLMQKFLEKSARKVVPSARICYNWIIGKNERAGHEDLAQDPEASQER